MESGLIEGTVFRSQTYCLTEMHRKSILCVVKGRLVYRGNSKEVSNVDAKSRLVYELSPLMC